ncbi:MAG TPA: hypothetical protein IAB12_04515 [Candidatus Ornithospirochaeta avicola]|uniref:Uncharacterized protein n=1 Tax=Candidatus Ornithospirochaeta avicola TaxID=2840896 RepID=A0A9D1PSQ4_9SPIO|nr:hypothetical protein [Candidatus Ornithospirochaeta avicola]
MDMIRIMTRRDEDGEIRRLGTRGDVFSVDELKYELYLKKFFKEDTMFFEKNDFVLATEKIEKEMKNLLALYQKYTGHAIAERNNKKESAFSLSSSFERIIRFYAHFLEVTKQEEGEIIKNAV